MKGVGRQQAAFHQGERVVHQPRVQPGDQGAGKHGQEDEAQHSRGPGDKSCPIPGHHRIARLYDVQRGPQRKQINRQRQGQMGGQAVLADRRLVDQPAFHHVPAQHPLQPAEHEQNRAFFPDRAVQAPFRQEPGKGNEKHNPDDASEQAVQVFQPEDFLKPAEAHPRVDVPVFRALPVGIEGRLPGGFGQGRQPARNRMPVNHGQTRLGQACHPAKNDHGEDHGADHQQPSGDGIKGAGPGIVRFAGIRGGVHGGFPRFRLHSYSGKTPKRYPVPLIQRGFCTMVWRRRRRTGPHALASYRKHPTKPTA